MDYWTQLARFSVIETERLILRPFTFQDSEAFYQIVGKPENLPFIFPACPDKVASDYLLTHKFLKQPLGTWAICDKVSLSLLGALSFENRISHKSSVEIGYFIKRQSWGQGIMTEALRTIVWFAFNAFGLQELTILTHLENQASQRVAKKAGFKKQEQFKGSDRFTKKTRHYVRYQMKLGDYHYE
ncbi:GNAT family N-acetyltransferase [Streptococcus halichoeri]|uniref:GNAT family N-acetyltransferase n=1 Tax=Streptococcus halichoeri TaxID=254785 RepID=UPI00135B8EEC|nr:GNAT family N-acetyltransferase [Streptococcus halichoeri]